MIGAAIPAAVPLSGRLREATWPMHRIAEGSTLMRDLLAGRLALADYCRLLRNLHALYVALESGLEMHAATLLAPIVDRRLFRAEALARDLDSLHGPGWPVLSLTAAMDDYAARLDENAKERPVLLAAHAYVRTMGDLSGGRIVGDVLAKTLLRDRPAAASFYRFDLDATMAKARFAAGLDALAVDAAASDAIVEEACDAFARHVRLFDELSALCGPPPG